MAGRQRPKGTGSVFRDSRGYWHYRMERGTDFVTGKRLQPIEATGKVKADAKRRFEEKRRRYEQDGWLRTNSVPTLSEYAREWLDRKRPSVNSSTLKTLTTCLRHACERMGGMRLCDIRPAHVWDYVSWMVDERRFAPSTVETCLVKLRGLLEAAVDDGLIQSNPAKKVKAPRRMEEPVRILGRDEPRMLIDAIGVDVRRFSDDSPDDLEMWRLWFELAFATGMRPGERRGITVDELKWYGSVHGIEVRHQLRKERGGERIPDWAVERDLGNGWKLTSLKTSRAHRFVPLSDDLWDRVQARIRRFRIPSDGLLFTLRSGNPISRVTERDRWVALLDHCGIPRTRVYSMRHWAATMLAESGASDDLRMAMMGHTSIGMTSHYTHWQPKALAAAMGEAMPAFTDAEAEASDVTIEGVVED